MEAVKANPALVAALASLQFEKQPSGPIFVAAPTEDREMRRWREVSEIPNLVCIVKDGIKIVATYGPEPQSYKEWLGLGRRGRLDRGGKGFAFFGFDGRVLVTHNLAGEHIVPPAYAHLFRATHRSCRSLSDVEENAHWSGLDEWTQEAA